MEGSELQWQVELLMEQIMRGQCYLRQLHHLRSLQREYYIKQREVLLGFDSIPKLSAQAMLRRSVNS